MDHDLITLNDSDWQALAPPFFARCVDPVLPSKFGISRPFVVGGMLYATDRVICVRCKTPPAWDVPSAKWVVRNVAGEFEAITNRVETPAWLLAGGVLCWTAGFDILYALQDQAFDRDRGLHSIPVRLGTMGSLWLSRLLHLVALALWAGFNHQVDAHLFPWLAWLAVACILAREQWLVRNGNLDRIDQAFFTLNSLVGMVFFAGHLLEWLLLRSSGMG